VVPRPDSLTQLQAASRPPARSPVSEPRFTALLSFLEREEETARRVVAARERERADLMARAAASEAGRNAAAAAATMAEREQLARYWTLSGADCRASAAPWPPAKAASPRRAPPSTRRTARSPPSPSCARATGAPRRRSRSAASLPAR